MTGVPAALVLAGLMLTLTVFGSMIVAAALGGTSRLLPGFRGNDPPQTGLLAASTVIVGGAIAIVPQLADIAAGLAPDSMFGPLGSAALKTEPVVAILWTWYLHSRYRR